MPKNLEQYHRNSANHTSNGADRSAFGEQNAVQNGDALLRGKCQTARGQAQRHSFNADFVVLGMSGSYQTLSRRITAMKTIRTFSRKQIALAGCAIFLLATVELVPWQVVAQDPKPPALPGVSGRDDGADKGAAPSPQPSPIKGEGDLKHDSKTEKLLIGTWRGGPSGSDVLTIQKDGSYSWLFRIDGQQGGYGPPRFSGRTIPPVGRPGLGGGAFPLTTTYNNNSGRWKMEGDTLVLIYQPAALSLRGFTEAAPGAGTTQPTDLWPTDFTAAGNVYTGRLSVVRVDDSLLRLMGMAQMVGDQRSEMVPTSPKFFKHLDNQQATPKFAADVPKELQNIAQLTCMNADEAHLMVQWFTDANKNLEAQHRKGMHFDLIDRLQAARNGKIDFAELFQLTPEEAKDYREVNKLAGGIGAVSTLAEQGQLTPIEQSALKKITKFKTEIDSIGAMIDYESRMLANPGGGAAGEIGFPMPGTIPTDEVPSIKENVGATPSYLGSADNHVRTEMISKLQTLLIELDSWLTSTVFN